MTRRSLVLLCALLALIAKVWCAATTIGTNDAEAFYNFGRFIWEHGLLAQYRATAEFNHTPLVGWFCAAIYGLGHGWGFLLLLRLPGIVADFLAVRTVLDLRDRFEIPNWALILFALSPVSFMVSGFHGNVDSILTWLLLETLRAAIQNRPSACAMLFGLACQVKVIPLLMAPTFFFYWWKRGRGSRFLIVASGVILAGWSPALATMPDVFLAQVLGYNSNWGSWGITYLLFSTGRPEFHTLGFRGLSPHQLAVMAALKAAIIVNALWLARRRSTQPAPDLAGTLAMIWAGFFLLAPGVGAQYLVWITPFLLLTAPAWYGALTLASTVFLAIFYTVISHGFPWDRGLSTAELVPFWAGWTLLPWAVFAFFLGSRIKAAQAWPCLARGLLIRFSPR